MNLHKQTWLPGVQIMVAHQMMGCQAPSLQSKQKDMQLGTTATITIFAVFSVTCSEIEYTAEHGAHDTTQPYSSTHDRSD
jgi:hypothetical protein